VMEAVAASRTRRERTGEVVIRGNSGRPGPACNGGRNAGGADGGGRLPKGGGKEGVPL
jgi:hypothetical protein